MTSLYVLKEKYRLECIDNQETLTYRGLLKWLGENGLKIEYHKGIDLGLLDFNNELFDELALKEINGLDEL